MGYRSSFLGRSTQKAWFIGWPPVNGRSGATARWRMPSHPSVRHYDRSGPMRPTNPRCRQAVVRKGPFEASRPSLFPQPEAARIRAGAKYGSDDREIRAGGAARRSSQHPSAPKRRPPPLRGQDSIHQPGADSRAGYLCLSKPEEVCLCEPRSRPIARAPHPVPLRGPTLPTRGRV